MSLPFKNKVGYGIAEIGITSVQLLTQIYLLKYYTEVVGLSPALTGIALSISIFWDAISDPLMGIISDNTRSSWGKRRPYILFGGFLLSLTIILLFSPPALESQTGKFLILLSTYLLVNTAMTIISVPHISLGGELTTDRNERTELYGWRLVFSNLGMLVGMIVPVLVLSTFSDPKSIEAISESRSDSATIIAGILFLSSVATFLLTKEKTDETIPRSVSFKHLFVSLFSVLKNKAFVPLFIAFFIATFGRIFNSSLALYYYEFRLGLPESQVVLNILLPFFLVILASVPFWVSISKRYGKKFPAFIGVLGLGVMTIIVYPLFPKGELRPPLIAAFLGGIFAGSILLFDSIVSDIVDYDRLKTKENREGLFFGFWKMGTKLAQALAIAASGFALEAIGFVQGSVTQSPEIGFPLAILFGPVVGSFFVLGSFVFLLMPLTDEKHIQVQRILKRKNKFLL